jgi:hypothetical protein
LSQYDSSGCAVSTLWGHSGSLRFWFILSHIFNISMLMLELKNRHELSQHTMTWVKIKYITLQGKLAQLLPVDVQYTQGLLKFHP